ncbi:ribokinase [Nomia melanderi]|uniref:ribokinase n=1 Tax=Nomia melanderi TaxID=2448451 RepID=UPI00130474D8|nr:ribokinase-like [Nomia melanderi]XP_031843806.1 ribokinase-like [Nomia melanderi]XP_031843807.1 ribokinase-like [Nomia melanderi]XP_031843808.1 ribokinase-like [Nomia melanderi]XP_031843810.1 ribokinase-like [Nomia melanderi]XP_031843811.1 ribokinase-like [Nomia melanderi]
MVPKVVIVGSCMIDFTCFSPRLPKPGETLIGSKYEIKYGGKGANQCVTAAKLGASTAIVACLGSDTYAQEYLKIFKQENVNVSHIHIQENQHSGIAHITVADNGENSIVVVLGSNASLTSKYVDAAAEAIRDAAVLLCQLETPLETTRHALKLHKGHGLSIINGAPAMEHVDPEILSLCDIFCVNETEAEVMTGVQPLGLSSVQEAIDKLLDYGCNTVILTLGEMGAAFASKENRTATMVPTTPVQPVDTTGAGDAFLGALAYFKAYHPALPMDECIRRACVVATESVLKVGTHASFPTRSSLSPDLFL